MSKTPFIALMYVQHEIKVLKIGFLVTFNFVVHSYCHSSYTLIHCFYYNIISYAWIWKHIFFPFTFLIMRIRFRPQKWWTIFKRRTWNSWKTWTGWTQLPDNPPWINCDRCINSSRILIGFTTLRICRTNWNS